MLLGTKKLVCAGDHFHLKFCVLVPHQFPVYYYSCSLSPRLQTTRRPSRSCIHSFTYPFTLHLFKLLTHSAYLLTHSSTQTRESSMQIVLLHFVRFLNYKIIKSQRFGSWILLPSSGKKEVKRTESLSAGPPD
jgi:hypothetical protein